MHTLKKNVNLNTYFFKLNKHLLTVNKYLFNKKKIIVKSN